MSKHKKALDIRNGHQALLYWEQWDEKQR